MLRVLLLLAVFGVSHAHMASATSISTVQTIDCAGDLQISLGQSALLSCGGDFSVFGGTITSDTSIVISALGSLRLDNLEVRAPSVAFSSAGELFLGGDVSIVATSVALSSFADGSVPPSGTGGLTIGSGATLSLSGTNIFNQPLNSGSIVALQGNSQLSVDYSNIGLVITPAIPEPNTLVTSLLGIIVLMVAGKFSRKIRLT